jgi:acetyl/propionyl-CoA carboxylase alpha subunit
VQAWGPTRDNARRRLICALSSLGVDGIETTAPYLEQVLRHTDFATVAHDTGSVERVWQPDPALRPRSSREPTVDETAGTVTPRARRVRLSTSQRVIEVDVHGRRQEKPVACAAARAAAGASVRASVRTSAGTAPHASRPSASEPVAPIDGAVIQVAVKVGDVVDEGALLVVVEAMKMELAVRAPRAGRVDAVLVEVGQVASRGSLLVQLTTLPLYSGSDVGLGKEEHVPA